MTVIHRHALVPYTPTQMFELVNNIEDYQRFLPWCSKSHVISRTETEVEAKLEITWSGIHKSFTTRNHLQPPQQMVMKLVEGPFKHLEGHWHFTPLGEHGCKVNMELEFELAGNFVDKIFLPIFNNIANSLVEKFCQRAVEVYGQR